MSLVRTYAGAGLASIDAKGRVTLPSDIRDVVFASSGDQKVCIAMHEDLDCLVGFGGEERERKISDIDFQWQSAVQAGRDFNSEEAAVADYSLTFWANCEASGRFVLNPDLREMAGIEGRAFFYGAGRNFCIWNPDLFLQADLGQGYKNLRRFLELQLKKEGLK